MNENDGRIFSLNAQPVIPGPVVYWMTREIRAHDNHALIVARSLSVKTGAPLKAVFCFADSFLNAGLRQFSFLAYGLEEAFQTLSAKGIACAVLHGNPALEISRFLAVEKAGALVCDTSPLIIQRQWRDAVIASSECAAYEVDSRCIVPARIASDKKEYGAYTLRPKIKALLPLYFHEPELLQRQGPAVSLLFKARTFLSEFKSDKTLPVINEVVPGEKAAHSVLASFIANGLNVYGEKSADPNASALSGLSPYLHFGMISSLRAALSCDASSASRENIDAFLEQLIVRRELAENFCLYDPHYDSSMSYPAWALKTLEEHRSDNRDYLYTCDEFETASTHDQLWNAAQNELRSSGKIHGYMRMYWAKKILEWTVSREEAARIAVYLNDRWALDGRDPNGYAGIAWSMGGVHDRAWGERSVFGKIRYMNAAGCARKFDVKEYINRWNG